MISRNSTNYRRDIDGLRAIAVLSVIAFHLFPTVVTGGFVGVDVFFVISGYLITRILWNELEAKDYVSAIISFYSRRIKRIFPVLLLVFVACLIAGFYLLYDDDFRKLSEHVAASSAFIANLCFWRESGYFDSVRDAKPLVHLWSLGVEEQFYLGWPLVLCACWCHRRFAVPLTAAVLLLSFTANIYWAHRDIVGDFYSPISRAWELMSGALIAFAESAAITGASSANVAPGVFCRFQRRLSQPICRDIYSVAGLSLIVLSALFMDPKSPFPGRRALWPVAGAFLIITAGPSAFMNRFALSSRVMVGIGLISYALYLWHWPLLVFAGFKEGQPLATETSVAVLAVSVALSVCCYFFLEAPVRASGHSRIKVATLCVLMLAIGLTGCAIFRNTNIHTAISERVKAYSLDSDEVSALWRRDRCMLEDQNRYAPECVPPPGPGPIVMLWGDSHAAALYPALVRLKEDRLLRIAQFTASRCPPLFGYVGSDPSWNNPNCNTLNEYVRRQVSELRPETVIMTAFWQRYGLNSVMSTIQTLQDNGVKHIILIGETPQTDNLKNYVALHINNMFPIRRVPFFYVSIAKDEDVELRSIARATGTSFISAIDILCDRSGCLTMTSNAYPELMYVDSDHVSPAGAELVLHDSVGQMLNNDERRRDDPAATGSMP